MEQLLFEQTARGAVLKKYTGHAAHVTVPAQAHGKPVVEIADYAFANHEQLQRVSLPACVEDIGNHVFYNCHALEQLHLAHGLRSVGDGAFKNCRNLHAISVNGLTWLKSLVTDFTNEITLTIHERGETIVLLFPAYDYAFQEIIPPREFRSVTYGSGSFYRMCVTRKGIDFREYDKTFSRAVREDAPETVQDIAFYRLLYPYRLLPDAREQYLSYLTKQADAVISRLLEQRNLPRLQLMLDEELLSESVVSYAIGKASELDEPEAVSLMMDYRLKHFGNKKHRFAL